MTLFYISLIIIAVAVAGSILNFFKGAKLNKYAERLYMRENRIKEREAVLEADRRTTQTMQEEYRKEIVRLRLKETPVEITAEYVVTESDEMKYNTEKAIYANAKNRLAMTIAHDIVKNFEPEESTTESGRKKFAYNLHITE